MIQSVSNRCSICSLPYSGYGNNAQPVNDGRCCDACNATVVVRARLRAVLRAQAGDGRSQNGRRLAPPRSRKGEQ